MWVRSSQDWRPAVVTRRSWRHKQGVDNRTCRRLSSGDRDHWTTCAGTHRGRRTLEVVDSRQHQATVCALSLWPTTSSRLLANSVPSVALCLRQKFINCNKNAIIRFVNTDHQHIHFSGCFAGQCGWCGYLLYPLVLEEVQVFTVQTSPN